jgi:X-X-X-Leu-X-X-Gly heptad repeat protein
MHSGMRKAQKSLAGQLASGVNSLRDLAGDLADAVHSLAEGRPPRIEELTMTDVVGFFVGNKGAAPAAAAGVILRGNDQPAGRHDPDAAEAVYLVHLFFLDSGGQPLITAGDPRRTYLTPRFDDELAAAFGANNIVIFN